NEIYEVSEKNIHKKIILICRSGSRTKLASNLLAEQGFSNIYNVRYGFQYDWLKVKLPTEK
ncbi:rhodanese-like domain-containing protein, partial [Poseidonibacter ostreae]